MSKNKDEVRFEDAVVRLETIVAEMESGSLPLHECLARFEEAVALSRVCTGQLEAAEKRISVLSAEHGLQPAADLPWAEEEIPSGGEE